MPASVQRIHDTQALAQVLALGLDVSELVNAALDAARLGRCATVRVVAAFAGVHPLVLAGRRRLPAVLSAQLRTDNFEPAHENGHSAIVSPAQDNPSRQPDTQRPSVPGEP